MLQTVARGTYFGSPGAGAEEGQPLRLRHRSSAARGEPSGSQRSRETAARIRPGCRAHAARRKRQMGEEVGSLSALQGCQRCERTLAVFSGLARRGGEPNVDRASHLERARSEVGLRKLTTIRLSVCGSEGADGDAQHEAWLSRSVRHHRGHLSVCGQELSLIHI